VVRRHLVRRQQTGKKCGEDDERKQRKT
jgi:hypothetical protein